MNVFESFVNSIPIEEFHVHSREVRISRGDKVLYCPGCGKEYARVELEVEIPLPDPEWGDFEMLDTDENVMSGRQMAVVFVLSFFSGLTLLSLGEILINKYF